MYYWKQTAYNEYVLLKTDGGRELFVSYKALWDYCKARNIDATQA